MTEIGFPSECGVEELDRGYRVLVDWLAHPGVDPLTDLAVDYARVFLGAGISEGIVAYPYESVYTSGERLIMQEARDRVVEAYRARGFDKLKTLEVPEDHIALELEFMARLSQGALEAGAAGDWTAATTLLHDQELFLEQHLLNWTGAFCADIRGCAATDFYRAVAWITDGFLEMERMIIEDLISESVSRAS